MLDPVVESLMEIFDEFHSQKSKMDGLRGMRENIKQGWRAGGRAILGYKLEKHVVGTREGQPITKSKLAPDPKTFQLIQAYLKGRSIGESRKALINSLNLTQNFTTLVYIEDSAMTYAGHTVWNRHNEYIDGQYVGGKRYKDQSEWVITRDTHPAMISDEESRAILKQRDSQRKKQRRFRRNNYLLSTLLRCACGANIDGEGGYYRCHDRCGCRSIKQERLEEAVISLLFEEFLTNENIQDLKKEIEKQLEADNKGNNNLLAELEKELKEIERQISEVVTLLPQVQHQRPLLARLDQLEEDRISTVSRVEEEQDKEEPMILRLSDIELAGFLENYRKNLEFGEAEKKKAILRSVIEYGVFDGTTLKINPSYQIVAGVNLASPRGFEPLSPP